MKIVASIEWVLLSVDVSLYINDNIGLGNAVGLFLQYYNRYSCQLKSTGAV